MKLTEKKVGKLNFEKLSVECLEALRERVEEELREREREKE